MSGFYLSRDIPHREMINPAKLVKIPHISGPFALTFKTGSLLFRIIIFIFGL